MRTLIAGTTVLVAVITVAGCAAPLMMAAPLGVNAARSGAAAYTRGELRVARYATLEEAWLATHLAVERLQLVVHVERIGERRWYLMAKDDSRGPEVQIRFDRRSPVMTKISIRVGFLGDPAVSNQIMRHIDEFLVAQRGQPPAISGL